MEIRERLLINCDIWTFFLFSELNEGKMTVGKIYVGLLIAENWKAYKASQINGQTTRKVWKYTCFFVFLSLF